jgi:hypothetical protein
MVGRGQDLLLVVLPVEARQVERLETGLRGEVVEDRLDQRFEP